MNDNFVIRFDKRKNSLDFFFFKTFYDINEAFNFDKILIRIIIKFGFKDVKKCF